MKRQSTKINLISTRGRVAHGKIGVRVPEHAKVIGALDENIERLQHVLELGAELDLLESKRLLALQPHVHDHAQTTKRAEHGLELVGVFAFGIGAHLTSCQHDIEFNHVSAQHVVVDASAVIGYAEGAPYRLIRDRAQSLERTTVVY